MAGASTEWAKGTGAYRTFGGVGRLKPSDLAQRGITVQRGTRALRQAGDGGEDFDGEGAAPVASAADVVNETGQHQRALRDAAVLAQRRSCSSCQVAFTPVLGQSAQFLDQ